MRGKISPAIKQKAVMEIESGRLSQGEVARRLRLDGETVRSWLTAYRGVGNAGLECGSKNRIYTVQTKQQAVEAYLTVQYSLQKICEIFKIRSKTQLLNWLKVYNSGRDFKRMSGGSRTKSTHKATQEERVQIAKDCVVAENNYGEIAKKYGVSYQQTRAWTLKYKELGEVGLEDRRGKRKYEQEPRTELEQAQIGIAQLKRQLHTAEMKNQQIAEKVEHIQYAASRQRLPPYSG